MKSVEVVNGVIKPDTSIQGRDCLDLILRKVEANNIKVLSKTFGVVTLGNNGEATLGCPAKEDLTGGPVVFCGNRLDEIMLKQGLELQGLLPVELNEALRTEGRVGSHSNTLLLAEVDEVGLGKVGVMFDLEDGDGNLGGAEEIHEKRALEIGDTDRANELFLNQVLESAPGLKDGNVDGNNTLVNAVIALVGPSCGVVLVIINVFEGNREMDQEEIEVVEAPPLELLADNGFNLVLLVEGVPEFRGDEEVFAFNKAFINCALDTLASDLLVAVIECTVKEAVTGLDGVVDGLRAVFCDLPQAETDLRHFVARLECERRNCGHRYDR